jgi:hypothetical protein
MEPLIFFADATSRPDWARLGQHLPHEWIAQAVAYTGKARIRRRRLPAGQDGKRYLFNGPSLLAMDGATLRTSDTPAQ